MLAADCKEEKLHAEWEDTVQQWYNWLHEKKKNRKKKKKKKKDEDTREEEHQKLVIRRNSRDEGGAYFLHRITKLAAWRGGVCTCWKGWRKILNR